MTPRAASTVVGGSTVAVLAVIGAVSAGTPVAVRVPASYVGRDVSTGSSHLTFRPAASSVGRVLVPGFAALTIDEHGVGTFTAADEAMLKHAMAAGADEVDFSEFYVDDDE